MGNRSVLAELTTLPTINLSQAIMSADADLWRINDAVRRAEGAVQRAKTAAERIKFILNLEARKPAPIPTDRTGMERRSATLIMHAHQRLLADRQVKKADNWLSKLLNRRNRWMSRREAESFEEIMEYAQYAERRAHQAERQAWWADHYSNVASIDDLLDMIDDSGEDQ